jgi:hypothetical protein
VTKGRVENVDAKRGITPNLATATSRFSLPTSADLTPADRGVYALRFEDSELLAIWVVDRGPRPIS